MDTNYNQDRNGIWLGMDYSFFDLQKQYILTEPITELGICSLCLDVLQKATKEMVELEFKYLPRLAWIGHVPCIQSLLRRCDPDGNILRKAFEAAAWKGNIDCCNELVSRFGISNEGKARVVSFAALGSQLDFLKQLDKQEYKAFPTAFHCALYIGDWTVFQYLCEEFTSEWSVRLEQQYESIIENVLWNTSQDLGNRQILPSHRRCVYSLSHPFQIIWIPMNPYPRKSIGERIVFMERFIDTYVKSWKDEHQERFIEKLFYEINRCAMNDINWNDGWWYSLLRQFPKQTKKYYLIRAKYEETDERIHRELETIYKCIDVPCDVIRYIIQTFL